MIDAGTCGPLGHIGLAVRDLDRAFAFCTEMVGLRLTESFEYPEENVGHGNAVRAGAFLRCGATLHCLSIFALKSGVEPRRGARVRAAPPRFELRTPGELLTEYREFKDAGVPIVNARRSGPGNQPRFYARDPDGNLLEFHWGIDEIGWDV